MKENKKQIILLGLNSFFTDISSEMVLPLFPVFLTTYLGASSFILGVVEGLAELSSKILPFFSGKISDKVKNWKLLAFIGYAISNLVKPLLYFANTILFASLIRIIDRIGKGIRTTPRDLLISEFGKKKEGSFFGLHKMFDKLGAIMGAVISLLLIYFLKLNIRFLFLISFIPGVIALIILTFLKRPKVMYRKIKTKKNKTRISKLLIFLFGLITISYGLFYAHYINEKEKIIFAPLAYLIMNFGGASVIFIGKIFDKMKEKTFFKYLLYFYSFIFLLFSLLPPKLITFLLLIFIYGIVYNSLQLFVIASIAKSSKLEKGKQIGFTYLILGISSLIGNSLFGFLVSRIGFSFATISFSLITLFTTFFI